TRIGISLGGERRYPAVLNLTLSASEETWFDRDGAPDGDVTGRHCRPDVSRWSFPVSTAAVSVMPCDTFDQSAPTVFYFVDPSGSIANLREHPDLSYGRPRWSRRWCPARS